MSIEEDSEVVRKLTVRSASPPRPALPCLAASPGLASIFAHVGYLTYRYIGLCNDN